MEVGRIENLGVDGVTDAVFSETVGRVSMSRIGVSPLNDETADDTMEEQGVVFAILGQVYKVGAVSWGVIV